MSKIAQHTHIRNAEVYFGATLNFYNLRSDDKFIHLERNYQLTSHSLQGRVEKFARALRERRAYRSGHDTSWAAAMAILHPGVLHVVRRGFVEAVFGLEAFCCQETSREGGQFFLNYNYWKRDKRTTGNNYLVY